MGAVAGAVQFDMPISLAATGCFGSQADLKADITPTAAIGAKAAPENAGFAR